MSLSDKLNFNRNKFSFNTSHSCSCNHLRIECINIRYVLNKVDILENYLYISNVDLFFLTETWLTPKVIDAIVCPSNYKVVRKDRKSRGEGVAVIYKNFIKYLKLKNI